MPRYKAYATISYDLVCDFEVEEGEDPWAFAKDLDGGDFKEIPMTGDWNIYEVELIEEIQNA